MRSCVVLSHYFSEALGRSGIISVLVLQRCSEGDARTNLTLRGKTIDTATLLLLDKGRQIAREASQWTSAAEGWHCRQSPDAELGKRG